MKKLLYLCVLIVSFFTGYVFSYSVIPYELNANEQPIILTGKAYTTNEGEMIACECPRSAAICYCIIVGME